MRHTARELAIDSIERSNTAALVWSNLAIADEAEVLRQSGGYNANAIGTSVRKYDVELRRP